MYNNVIFISDYSDAMGFKIISKAVKHTKNIKLDHLSSPTKLLVFSCSYCDNSRMNHLNFLTLGHIAPSDIHLKSNAFISPHITIWSNVFLILFPSTAELF